jgi:WD40 repeat protein
VTPPPTLLIQGHSGPVYCALFSPDGKYIVSAGEPDVWIWDAQTGKSVFGPLETGGNRAVCSVAFSPNGRRIAVGAGQGVILVWDAATGKIIFGPTTGHTDYIDAVAFSPDGRKIMSGSRDSKVRIWDAERGKSILGPLSLPSRIRSGVFSRDGKRIAVAGEFGVDIINAKSGVSIRTFNLSHLTTFVAFSVDEQVVISCDESGQASELLSRQMMIDEIRDGHAATDELPWTTPRQNT